MKKSNLLIYGLLTCIALSIMAMCFTFSWFDLHPSYSDLILTTGDYPMAVTAKSYLKHYTYDAQGVEQTTLGTTLGKDFNITTVGPTNDIILNNDSANTNSSDGYTEIETSSGAFVINFAPMNFDLFADPNILDPELSGSLDFERFCFAFIEFDIFKQYFNAFLKAEYKVNVTTKDAVASSLDIGKLFKIRLIKVDDAGAIIAQDKTHMLGESTDLFAAENMKKLHKYDSSLLDKESVVPSSASYNNSVFGYEADNTTPVQKEITPNATTISSTDSQSNTTVEKCYAYAFAFGFYMDPIYLFDYLRNIKTSNFGAGDTFKVDFEIKFTTSNERI